MGPPRFPRERFGALFDAHVHTCFDLHDGLLTPSELAALTAQHGFTWVLAMNHDTMRGVHRVKRAARDRGLPCLTGIEVSTMYNHVLGYGVQEWNLRDNAWDPEVVIEKLREQDCAIFLAHPCNNPCNGHWTPDVAVRLDIDGVEWNNASNSILNRKTERAFATFPPGRRIAGTDAHTRHVFGHAYTQVATASTDPDDLVAAMKRGRCAPRGRLVPLVSVGLEQLKLVVKNKVVKHTNVDGTWTRTVDQDPRSVAPDGFPPANSLSSNALKAHVKPAAIAWRDELLQKQARLDWWHP